TDYAPGETVTITGTGWLPGETVTLNIHRDTNDPPDTVLTAVADVDGNITNSEYVVQNYDIGVVFLLTATGQTSGYTAQTSFTDGNARWTIAPNGTAAIVETLYTSGTNCTGAIKNNYPKTVDNNSDNVGVGSNESLRLDAPTNQSAPNAFRVFVAWSTTNGATFNVVAGTGGKSICVPDQSGNPDLVATYSCVA